MTATCNDDCHNHLCLPVLSLEGTVSVLLDSLLRKKKMIELVEEIFGTREVLVASRAVQNVSRPVFSGLSGQLNEPVSLEMVLQWMHQWWLLQVAFISHHTLAC